MKSTASTRAQQDAFLPHVEKGLITLIGATTENPSFEVNAALLSRCKVLTLKALSPDDIREIVKRALTDETNGLGARGVAISENALTILAESSYGDARRSLSTLEAAVDLAEEAGLREITAEIVSEAQQKKQLLYDKAGEEHYNVISRFYQEFTRGPTPTRPFIGWRACWSREKIRCLSYGEW